WIYLIVSTDRLERRSDARLGMTVVDKQRCAALGREPPRRFRYNRRGARGGFENRPHLRPAPTFRNRRIHRLRAGPEDEPFLSIERNHSLAPALLGHHQLPYRQRVEKLVGDKQDRPTLGHGRQIGVELCAGYRFPLQPA